MRWPSLKRAIQAPKQLLVEGRTAEIFFREWIDALGLRTQVEVRDFQSLAELTAYLKVFTSYSGFRETVVSLGVVRDAESRPATSAFQSVCSSFAAVNLSCPEAIGCFSGGVPRPGVFVMPDCQQPGMLETLCWSALAADPKMGAQLGCVNAYLDCLRGAKVLIANEAKARVWAYLAGLGQFEPQVGRAAQARVWDWSSPVLTPLALFLRAL
jgi:hypothetical protein